jgi:hypothetical protein
MGKRNYDILKEICDKRYAGMQEAKKKNLPLFVIQHPASL